MGGGGGGGGGKRKWDAGGGGKGGGKEKRKRTESHADEDPAGSCRVFVRGLDYNITDEQLESHMKKAGPIHTVHWAKKGSAVIVYKKKASAEKAKALDKSTPDGCQRYIEVLTPE